MRMKTGLVFDVVAVVVVIGIVSVMVMMFLLPLFRSLYARFLWHENNFL